MNFFALIEVHELGNYCILLVCARGKLLLRQVLSRSTGCEDNSIWEGRGTQKNDPEQAYMRSPKRSLGKRGRSRAMDL